MQFSAAFLCGATLLLTSSTGRAQTTSAAMHEYFAGEKSSGFLWGGVGLAALGGGAVLATRKAEVAKGMAYPIVAIGVIQTIVGGATLAIAATNERWKGVGSADERARVESEIVRSLKRLRAPRLPAALATMIGMPEDRHVRALAERIATISV